MTKTLISRITSIVLSVSLLAPMAAFAGHTPEANPTLGDACGLDIVLLLDMSGSIGGNETDVKDAAKTFVNAFLPATPTMFGIVEFSTTATIVQDLTDDKTDLLADIDGVGPPTGLTNWEDAIEKGTEILEGVLDRTDADHPDLMVMITDGIPTASDGPGTDLHDAVVAADAAKTSVSDLGIRMLAVGIDAGGFQANLEAISGPVVSPPAAITKDTDVIMSDFDQLADTLAMLASELCEDANGGGDGDTTVYNENYAYVENSVTTVANTGGNSVNGGAGGSAGNGGSVVDSDDDNAGGMGGNGGNGGAGGTITTGAAIAGTELTNIVNYNDTTIDRCACSGGGDGNDTVYNGNVAYVGNGVLTFADSGANMAAGGSSADAGNGGSVVNSGDNNTGGAGGKSGNGGAGGSISTGMSASWTGITNLVNQNITLIKR